MRSAVLFASLMMGCTRNFIPAPFDAQLSMPSDVVIGWTPGLNEFDLAGFPILFNIGVTDGNGLPLPRTAIEVSTGWAGVYLMPEEAVEVVGYPGLPDGVTPEDARTICVDGNGNYALIEDWCAWFWDIEQSQFFSFTGTYADNFYVDTGGIYFYGPTYVSTQTNDLGIARLVAFVDHVPRDANSFASVEVSASIGFAAGTFNLTFSGESDTSTDTDTNNDTSDTSDTSDTTDTGG